MSRNRDRDALYAGPEPRSGDFVFDDAVAAVFPDMIGRSVPGYAAIINTIRLLAERYAQPGSELLDLGCSLGAASVALAAGAAGRGCRVIGIDSAPAMLQRAAESTVADYPDIEWRCADIRDVEIGDCSMVVLNFTLQFLPAPDRLGLLQRIAGALRPDGVLILSEKIRAADAEGDSLLTDLHHAFKQANGYSELEISRKRTALERVLVPEDLDIHRARLAKAGFRRVDLWFQCFNFASLVARR